MTRIYPILGEYTKAIAQYFNFPLINIETYIDEPLILLEENVNNSRSKYKEVKKPSQYIDANRKRTNNRLKVKCVICDGEFLDTSVLSHVYNAHKILRKQYL